MPSALQVRSPACATRKHSGSRKWKPPSRLAFWPFLPDSHWQGPSAQKRQNYFTPGNTWKATIPLKRKGELPCLRVHHVHRLTLGPEKRPCRAHLPKRAPPLSETEAAEGLPGGSVGLGARPGSDKDLTSQTTAIAQALHGTTPPTQFCSSKPARHPHELGCLSGILSQGQRHARRPPEGASRAHRHVLKPQSINLPIVSGPHSQLGIAPNSRRPDRGPGDSAYFVFCLCLVEGIHLWDVSVPQ